MPFEPIRVGLAVTVRVWTEAFVAEEVLERLAGALLEGLSLDRRRLGQALHRGQIFGLVDGVEGVENSDVTLLLSAADAARAAQVVRDGGGRILAIHASPRQLIHVADAAALVLKAEDFAL